LNQKKSNPQLKIPLFGDTETKFEIFRPIHYLGSKLRFLDFIDDTINQIDPSNGRICDLFAGSGTVSYKFSQTRPVVSVDIQNYSKVICSAILNPQTPKSNHIEDFLDRCKNSKQSALLEQAALPLIEFEVEAIKNALIKNDCFDLCDIIENGSLISHETLETTNASKRLLNAMIESQLRMKDEETKGVKSLSLKYFGGIYFSYLQCSQIDSILHQLLDVADEFKDFYLAALLSTVSEVVNTVGKQFAQPIRPRKSDGTIKPSLGKIVNKDRSVDVLNVYRKWIDKYSSITRSSLQHSVLNMDFSKALDYLPEDTTVIYADPPYTRDHYSRFYHVLETISIGDSPKISTMVLKGETLLSRGLYREDRHQSPFCIKSQAPKSFELMFSKAKNLGAKLVLSYSPFSKENNAHPRVVNLEMLRNLAKKYFNKVEIISVGNFSHSKLTHSEKHKSASTTAEVLIVCE